MLAGSACRRAPVIVWATRGRAMCEGHIIMDMKRFFAGLREMGFEKPRSAIALLPLSLFSFLYLLAAFNADPQWQLALGGLALCYLTAFVALASEWFWARWFASGLGWSGAMV